MPKRGNKNIIVPLSSARRLPSCCKGLFVLRREQRELHCPPRSAPLCTVVAGVGHSPCPPGGNGELCGAGTARLAP